MSGAVRTATTLEEAVAALDGGARVVAGGTDLVVGARQGKAPLPERLIAIHRLPGLSGVEETPAGGLSIGGLTTHAMVVSDSRVREQYTALADASAIVGSHATRAHGTLGGNVMNASPAMETGGPLLCFGATATLASAGGTREVALADLFVGPGRTVADPGELLTGISLPPQEPGTGSAYVRLEYRRQMEIAVVGATAVVAVTDGVVTGARVAITALAPTIRLVPDAAAALVGSDGGSAAVEVAAAACAAAATPISDVRASEGYRRAMAAVISQRAVAAALARARAGAGAIAVPASQHTRGGVG